MRINKCCFVCCGGGISVIYAWVFFFFWFVCCCFFLFFRGVCSSITGCYKRLGGYLILTKAGTCARDRRALQQLALNVHVKHTDLT